MATTLSSLWNGIGIVGAFSAKSADSIRRTGTSSADRSRGSVAVGKEHHPVPERLRPVDILLNGLFGIRIRDDEACGEVLVDLPVDVHVGFDCEILVRHAGPVAGRVIEEELVEEDAAADGITGRDVESDEM